MAVLLAWALLVTGIDLARILTDDDDVAPAAARPESRRVDSPAAAPTTSVPVQPPTSTVSVAAGPSTPRSGGASAGTNTAEPTPPTVPVTTVPTVTTAPPDVDCHSELALEDSPNTQYNFLCLAAGIPLTWPTDRITVRAIGLSLDQETALQSALSQWQAIAQFNVIRVDTPNADVVFSVRDLANGEGGHAQMHYTCELTCAYDHADVALSKNRDITEGLWVTTILHELGHVAGLNHVSRKSQVMYPNLTLTSPAVYADGDRAGFDQLARLRRR